MLQFVLKKDLPCIKAGRVIKLNNDGQIGTPLLMGIEIGHIPQYIFSIDVLQNSPDWFEEFNFDQSLIPSLPVKNK